MNIHKYTSYYIIEIHINRLITTTQIFIAIDYLIHINRLITTTQIFIAMDYLIMMSEKYLYFRKRKKKTFGKDIFYPPHRSGWIHVLWKYFLNFVFTKVIYKNLEEIGIIQDVSKLIVFVYL